jgi:hypothetical protein
VENINFLLTSCLLPRKREERRKEKERKKERKRERLRERLINHTICPDMPG